MNMKRRSALRKPQWYRMEAFFDDQAEVVTEVADAQVLLQGVFYEVSVACPACGAKVHLDKIKLRSDGSADLSPQLGMCLVPQEAVSNAQGEALRRMLEANLRMPVVLMSNNAQMVRLRPIHAAEADRILKGGDDASEGQARVISFQTGQEEQAGGQGVRAKDCQGSEGDPGSAGTDEGD